jgi:hypothetical protein
MNIKKKTLLVLVLAAFGAGCGYTKPKATMPAISQLSPGSTTAGSAAFQLEVEGANFVSGAKVNFAGVAETTTFVNANKVEASIPASAVAASGPVPVTVTNPGSSGLYGNTTGATSAPMTFTVN